MATYAIGDLQGCLRSLQSLLAHIHYVDGTDRLWLTGDLVNRGPESLETLRFLRTLTDPVIVLGNHDLHLLGVACGARRIGAGDTLEAILSAPDRIELLDWLRKQPLLYHDEHHDVAMVHAGVPAQWDIREARTLAAELEAVLRGPDLCRALGGVYGPLPDLWSPELSGAARLRFIANALTRIRYCDLRGRLDMRDKGPLGTQTPGLVPWFDVPGRRSRETRILFGHWSSLGRRTFGNVICLDSGCLWGGTLTALRLEDSVFFSVPCESRGA
ncbi:diadenosine tetraphosphatase [Acidiferrobacter sp. SPIII_3]|uniref:symmetrical bis(5'-nucleosyl)-tetraphosphatase n=1 Tax=Acidiferrobacter sp. SPIII_3 TaxID=1281578 RepID=UPI000D72BD79|nr:symmetrical bis(5'-nucleosyl)-tetraphosphatase [Acidiferrobacter sp. SPIII_3]AWP22048.1 diadenosine tetraphosphatase [Acidiferrobacter sp. SPIII_3]